MAGPAGNKNQANQKGGKGMSFEGKVVAITGGGVGMGREAAILYAKRGPRW